MGLISMGDSSHNKEYFPSGGAAIGGVKASKSSLGNGV